jgi:formate dehydrogenase accessory protein FdhE
MPTPNAPHPLTRDYNAQLRRAEILSSTLPPSREILAFYSKILSFQKSLVTQLAPALLSSREPNSRQFTLLRDSFDLTLLLPHLRTFLACIEQHAPAPLATIAHELSSLSSDDWIDLLTSYWQTGGLPERETQSTSESLAPSSDARQSPGDTRHSPLPTPHFRNQKSPLTDFFPRAFLQPYAALLASQSAMPPTVSTPNLCPLCGALPVLGILRPEGDGAKRSLLCSFCSIEWNFRRILCPHCGETDEPKLPVFIAEQFPHIRTEACDTCRTYLRSIDLSKDGHAIPAVDDLAALPLSLWAHEHHYSRLHPNLLAS